MSALEKAVLKVDDRLRVYSRLTEHRQRPDSAIANLRSQCPSVGVQKFYLLQI
jgi:hypothetical protein